MNVIFDEQTLREACVYVWGTNGAHVDILDHLIKKSEENKPTFTSAELETIKVALITLMVDSNIPVPHGDSILNKIQAL